MACVGLLDHFILVLELLDAHDRPENLFFGDLRVLSGSREHCRFHELSLLATPLSSALDLGSLFLATLDLAENLVHLVFADLRAVGGLVVQRVAYVPCFGSFDRSVQELVLDFLVHLHA